MQSKFTGMCVCVWLGAGVVIEMTNGQGYRAPHSHLGTKPGTSSLPWAVGHQAGAGRDKAFVGLARPHSSGYCLTPWVRMSFSYNHWGFECCSKQVRSTGPLLSGMSCVGPLDGLWNTLLQGRRGAWPRSIFRGWKREGRICSRPPPEQGMSQPAGGTPTLSSLLSLWWESPRGSAWSCFPAPCILLLGFPSWGNNQTRGPSLIAQLASGWQKTGTSLSVQGLMKWILGSFS